MRAVCWAASGYSEVDCEQNRKAKYYETQNSGHALCAFLAFVQHKPRRITVGSLGSARVSLSAAVRMTAYKTESAYRRYAIVVETLLQEGLEKLAAITRRRKIPSAARFH